MKRIVLLITLVSLLSAESLVCSKIGMQNRTKGTKISYTKEEMQSFPKLKLNVSNSTIVAKMQGLTETFDFTEIKYESRMYWSKNNMYIRRTFKNKQVFLWDIRKNSQMLTMIYYCQ